MQTKQRLPRAGRRRDCGLRREKRAASTKTAGGPAESGALRETLRTSGQIERPGRPGGRKTPAGKSAAVFRRSEEARTRRAGTPSEAGDLRRPKDRGLPAKAPAHPFCGHAARGGRQAGYPAGSGVLRPARGLRASFASFRRAGKADEAALTPSLSVRAAGKRSRRPSMAPKQEKSNKKGFPLPDKAEKGKPCLCSCVSVNPCTSRRRCSCRKDEWSEPARGNSSRRARPRSRTGYGRCPCVHGCP